MTITVTDIDQGPFVATGAAQTVPYTFMTLTDGEIDVFYDVGAGRVLIDPALHTVNPNKSVDGSAKEGGSVELSASAAPSGASIYLRANPRFDRDIVWSDVGSRLRNLNDENDRAVLRDLVLQIDVDAFNAIASGVYAARDEAVAAAGVSVGVEEVVEDALEQIQDLASGAPDAPSILNKADKDFANVVPDTGRGALETARIPTAEKYGTAQAAAVAALAASLPFFDAADNVIALTCADGRLDLLLRKIAAWPIGDQGRINITVPAGKYSFTSPQRLSHPCGSRIQIGGAAPTTLSYSSVFGTVSTGVRDHDVTLLLASGDALSVGDTIQISGISGTGEFGLLEGQWTITAKPASNRITFKVKAKAATLPAFTVAAMTIVKLNTVIEFLGCPGFTLHNNLGDGSSGAQPGGFRDIAIIGDATSVFNGLILEQVTVLVTQGKFGVSNFGGDNIYLIYNSVMYSVGCQSSNCGGNGVYVLAGGVFQGVSGAFTGNNTYGVYGAYGATLTVTNASASGNLNGVGTLCGEVAGNNMKLHANTSAAAYGTGGYMDLQGSVCIAAGSAYGIRNRGGSRIKIDNATFSGHTTDIYAEAGGVVEAIGVTAATFNPPVNTFGNGGAVILTSLTSEIAMRASALTVAASDPTVSLVDGSTTAIMSGDLGHLGIYAASVNRHAKLGYMNAGSYVDKFTFASGSTAPDPTANSTVSVTLTSNTTLTIKGRGTDGVVRTGTVTLA